MTEDDKSIENEPKSVVPTARDRWKILRQAILSSREGQQLNGSDDNQKNATTSLHSFAGYQLVTKQEHFPEHANGHDSQKLYETVRNELCQLEWDPDWTQSISDNQVPLALVQALHELVLAARALSNTFDTTKDLESLTIQINPHDVEIANQYHLGIEKSQDRMQSQLAGHCQVQSCRISCSFNDNERDPRMSLRIELGKITTGDCYKVQCYQHPSSNAGSLLSQLYIRERMSRQHFSLQELVSHKKDQHNVDNTGNVCIWDAEKTLMWALSQPEAPAYDCDTVLECGVGMAGLAGLSLARRATRILLTDGHEQCVHNNRINIRLQNAFARASPSQEKEDLRAKIDCRVLLWTLHDNVDKSLCDFADLTLVSDCTHFENYHGHLLWTLLQCTKPISGRIWMCQPNRGKSLERFLDMIQVVNGQQKPLVQIKELTFPLLEDLHKRFMGLQEGGRGADRFYRPNVHQPRILVLTKLRSLKKEDRSLIIEHLRQRDSKKETNET